MPGDLEPQTLLAINRLSITSRLLAATLHDLNNALQIISGSVEMLEARDDLPPASRPALGRVRAQSAHAARAISELLAFTRARTGPPTPLRFRDVTATAIDARRFYCRRHGLRVEVAADAHPPAEVRGHSDRLLQLVLNLLFCAEQSLSASNGGTIVVSLREEGSEAVLEVGSKGRSVGRDSGDTHESSPSFIDGVEFAVAAARLITEEHGGALTLASDDHGTKVTLKVPLAR